MKQIFSRLKNIVIYHFSPDKRELDSYIKRVRRIDPLTDADWERLRTLGQREKELKDKGFQKLIDDDKKENPGTYFKVFI